MSPCPTPSSVAHSNEQWERDPCAVSVMSLLLTCKGFGQDASLVTLKKGAVVQHFSSTQGLTPPSAKPMQHMPTIVASVSGCWSTRVHFPPILADVVSMLVFCLNVWLVFSDTALCSSTMLACRTARPGDWLRGIQMNSC